MSSHLLSSTFTHLGQLGNTYPFTEHDWRATLALAEDTCLYVHSVEAFVSDFGFSDGLALNLGSEDWQFTQAKTAYTLASPSKIKFFLSLDMNILPSRTREDGDELHRKVWNVIQSEGQMKWNDRPILSTFGGHNAGFGGDGWEGWLTKLNAKLDQPVCMSNVGCALRLIKGNLKVFFIPAFFIAPDEFIALPHVDGTFAWNNAW